MNPLNNDQQFYGKFVKKFTISKEQYQMMNKKKVNPPQKNATVNNPDA
jgi:hypothetical protein